ncbi:hypothetical protein XMIN_2670 [Xanthomonas citri pv. mangiferaeindicae LMG 941]|nr:hypothetical protein XMIN_2670 [Xanthomonas citri pv. mangiferaeindicae LMG 941]
MPATDYTCVRDRMCGAARTRESGIGNRESAKLSMVRGVALAMLGCMAAVTALAR